MNNQPALVRETAMKIAFRSAVGATRHRQGPLFLTAARLANDQRTGVIYARKGWHVTRHK